jgi:hypothetical protein
LQIFDFYAKQNIFHSKSPTFVEIEQNFKIVVLSEYVKFANDFNFPLKKDAIIEIFKKNAVNGREMKFDGFIKSLEKIAFNLNDGKIKSNLQKIQRIRAIGKDKLDTDDKNQDYSNKKINTQQSNSIDNNDKNIKSNINEVELGKNLAVSSIINIKSKKKLDEENKENKENVTNSNYINNTNSNNNEENNDFNDNNNNDINENFSQLESGNNENNNLNFNKQMNTPLSDNNIKDNNINNNFSKNLNFKNNLNDNNDKSNINTNIDIKKNEYSSNITKSEGEFNNKNEDEITAIRKNIFELKKKTLQELIIDLYEFMEVDDQKKLQKKLKGYINPFNSDKMTRIEDGDIKGIIKFDPVTSENIKKILKDRKEQKIKEQEEKEKLEKLKKEEERKRIHLRNKSSEKNIFYKEKPVQKYAEIQKKHSNIMKEKETKLTWDQIENLNFNHFITNREDDFNPNDLFDGANDSDDENIFDVSNIENKGYDNNTRKASKKSSVSNLLNIQIQSGVNMNMPQNNISNNNLDTLSDDQTPNQNKNQIKNQNNNNYYDKRNSSINNNLRNSNHQKNNSDIYSSNYSNSNNNKGYRSNNNINAYNNNNRYNNSNNNFDNSRNDLSFQDDSSRPSINNNIDKSPKNNANSKKIRNSSNSINNINVSNININNNNNNNQKGKNLNLNLINMNSSTSNNKNPILNNPIQKSGNSPSNNNSKINNNSIINKKLMGNIEKTEQLAREMERNRANKSAKVISKLFLF